MENYYELVKEYPESLKLGTVIKPKSGNGSFTHHGNDGINSEWFELEELKNNSEYFQKLIPLFFCEDFLDGSFPEQSCYNCNHTTCLHNGKDNLVCKGNGRSWQGELKGEPIYEGDKCWLVCKSKANNYYISYSDWTNITNSTFYDNYTEWKYFSNESNAKTYYNQLKWKNKLIFKSKDKIQKKSNLKYKIEIIDIDYSKAEYKTINENGIEGFLEFNDQDLYQLYQEKTPEQEANELGFKIGDKVWNKETKEYLGTTTKFYKSITENLCYITDISKGILDRITNKVAIHTPTKEDFEFITNLLNYQWISGSTTKNRWSIKKEQTCITLFRQEFVGKKYSEDSGILIITIDEYMKSIGEKPLFVTEDRKNIYEGMNFYTLWKITLKFTYWKDNNGVECIKYTADKYSKKDSNELYFSTKEAAEQYLESLKPKLEVNKWYKDPNSNWLVFITSSRSGYGFDTDNKWFENVDSTWGLKDIIPATDEEVRERLLKYAKENYPEGTKYKCVNNNEKIYHNRDNFQFQIDKYIISDKNIWSSITNSSGGWLYKDGKWAKIIEKPLFRDNNGKYRYKSDFEEGKVYKVNTGYKYNWVIRFSHFEGNTFKGSSCLSSDNYYDDKFTSSTVKSVLLISKDEIQWLEACEKAGKFVEKDSWKNSKEKTVDILIDKNVITITLPETYSPYEITNDNNEIKLTFKE